MMVLVIDISYTQTVYTLIWLYKYGYIHIYVVSWYTYYLNIYRILFSEWLFGYVQIDVHVCIYEGITWHTAKCGHGVPKIRWEWDCSHQKELEHTPKICFFKNTKNMNWICRDFNSLGDFIYRSVCASMSSAWLWHQQRNCAWAFVMEKVTARPCWKGRCCNSYWERTELCCA